MLSLDQFEQQAIAEKRTDYDHVYGYQCVDLILQYLAECYGLASGISGNAIDYWNKTSGPILTKFLRIATQDVQRGDIVVLNGLTGNPDGHIMIATGNVSGSEFEGLEQNGQNGDGDGGGPNENDGNQIRTRYVQKVRIAGVLRPEQAAAAPVLSATPAPQPPGAYTVIKPIPGYGDANNAANHASQVDTVPAGNYHIFNQADGMVNVTSNPNSPGSWINPSDNTAPAPAKATALPAAPLSPSGNPDNTYDVIKPIPGYFTATTAGNHTSPATEVPAGTYYVFNTYPNNANLINVTSKLGQPGSWINKSDNVVVAPPVAPPTNTAAPDVTPPTPAPAAPVASTADIPWQKTYRPFPKPVHYIATRELTVKDLSGQAPDGPLPKYDPGTTPPIGIVSAYGIVTFDNVDYYRLKTNNDPKFKFWYCVAKVDAATNTPNLLVMPTNPLTPPSKVSVARDTLELA